MSGRRASGRLLVDLAATPGDRALLRAAAEFARELGLALHGVFVEDEALFGLAGFPFVRELRMPTGEWRPLDAAALAGEFAAAAALARRLLDEAASAAGLAREFEVIRGDPRGCLAALAGAADIVVLPAGRSGDLRRVALACETSGGTLLLPPRPAVNRGPVVVVPGQGAGGEAALAAAVRFARAVAAPLRIDAASEVQAAAAKQAVALGLAPAQVQLRKEGRAAERLLVLPASGADQEVIAAALRRGTPVLLAGTTAG
jgi:hypothetical protein